MNPRNAITFLRSPTGVLLSFVVLLIFAIVFVKGFYDPNKDKPKTAAAPTPAEKTNRTSQILQTIQREIVPFKPPRTIPAAMMSTINRHAAAADQRPASRPSASTPNRP